MECIDIKVGIDIMILVFLVGLVVGFLVCADLTVDMLRRHGLFKDGKVLDLQRRNDKNGIQ